MENTTRIADLPDSSSSNNYGGSLPTSFSGGGGHRNTIESSIPTNYIPMNIHPNPYGNSAQNPVMPNPQPVHSPQQTQNIQFTEEQEYQMQNMQPRRLPSRDIPNDSTQFTQDEQVQPNYIPKSNISSDYVRDYEDISERKLKQHEEKKRKESRFDAMVIEMQIPLLMAALYFLFQLPAINTIIFKKLSFLAIYTEDGNFNLNGLFMKSLVFGFTFYSLQNIAQFLAE